MKFSIVPSKAISGLIIITLGLMTLAILTVAFLQLSTLKTVENSSSFIQTKRRMLKNENDIFISENENFMNNGNLSQQIPESIRQLWELDPHSKILRVGLVKPEVLSWNPRIILLHNFLSHEECDKLISFSKSSMTKSTVVDVSNGKSIQSRVRTSSGTFIVGKERNSEIIKNIETRIASYSYVPKENAEVFQILKYEPDQYYKPHHDYFNDEFNIKRGGQRVATMLMYLTDVEEGGETIFPQAGDGPTMCGGMKVAGISVKPKKGNAILFWSQKLDGTMDEKSLHGSCKVLKGEKWSATKWMRQNAFI